MNENNEISLKVKLKKPYTFEGTERCEIDLSKLESWTCDDLVNVSKRFNAATGGSLNPMDSILPESNLEYVFFVAAEATGLPLEFFKKLPARESGALKAAVIGFFNSGE